MPLCLFSQRCATSVDFSCVFLRQEQCCVVLRHASGDFLVLQKMLPRRSSAACKTGYNEFSLLSLSCSDYLALPAIKNRLKGKPISLWLPSQRVDRFGDNIANINGGTRQARQLC
eukprot:jgi/Mesen1/1857/ME000143S00901